MVDTRQSARKNAEGRVSPVYPVVTNEHEKQRDEEYVEDPVEVEEVEESEEVKLPTPTPSPSHVPAGYPPQVAPVVAPPLPPIDIEEDGDGGDDSGYTRGTAIRYAGSHYYFNNLLIAMITQRYPEYGQPRTEYHVMEKMNPKSPQKYKAMAYITYFDPEDQVRKIAAIHDSLVGRMTFREAMEDAALEAFFHLSGERVMNDRFKYIPYYENGNGAMMRLEPPQEDAPSAILGDFMENMFASRKNTLQEVRTEKRAREDVEQAYDDLRGHNKMPKFYV